MPHSITPSVDSPAMRQADGDLLSLALMDARNHTLHLIGQYPPFLPEKSRDESAPGNTRPLLWELGHVGWFQEWWIARNMHRQLGERCDSDVTRLGSIEPQADSWWGDWAADDQAKARPELPDLGEVKAYLRDTLETSLELLYKTSAQDDALYFFRLALFHEDLFGEALICRAQTAGLPLKLSVPGPTAVRGPLVFSRASWQLGTPYGSGFSFDNERQAYEVDVPEFEIDAQVVGWAQFVEFVDDGGYDRPELWQPRGWQWVQDAGRRAPRYVEQIGVASGAVMQTRFGTARRMLGGQPAMHVSWWEADAWCRWAGRRLPSEVEWEMAAHSALRRGFRWGDVWEWTGTTFQSYPGFVTGPWHTYSQPHFGTSKAVRGASFATRARMKNPKFRHFLVPGQDEAFVGFRSCSL